MPENTPMKMQWINIDGRSTPIVLPQIWDHEKQDWIVTGTKNPLPTQLTGSIVEVARFSDVTISTERTEVFRTDDFKYKRMRVTFRTIPTTAKRTLRIETRNVINGRVLNVATRESETLYNIEIFEEDEIGTTLHVRFDNQHGEDFIIEHIVIEGIL